MQIYIFEYSYVYIQANGKGGFSHLYLKEKLFSTLVHGWSWV